MGDVIRKTAAIEDIFADVQTTLIKARARGGKWQQLAEGRLVDVVRLIEATRARQAKADDDRAVLEAALDAEVERASGLVGKVSDDIWNAIGRPANDPGLAVMFPGGIAYYTSTATGDQTQRMDLLATLLESNIHPHLDPVVAKAAADSIRQEVVTLRAAEEPARLAGAEVRLSARVARSLGRASQMELANLKRQYRAEGFSEADIHTVIPDRPRAGTSPASAPPAPPTGLSNHPAPAAPLSLPPLPAQ